MGIHQFSVTICVVCRLLEFCVAVYTNVKCLLKTNKAFEKVDYTAVVAQSLGVSTIASAFISGCFIF